MRPYTLPFDWLSGRASSAEVVLRRYGDGGPLGKLVAAMQPGDELRKFNSPRRAWQKMAGRFGYAVVREGKPIAMVILRMN
jgi:hypothetical protein